MNKHEIIVKSNSPANDIHEFVRTCGIFVESYGHNEIILKSGNILKFCSDSKLPGIRNYYYYKEVFESYLKQYIRHLESQNVEQDKEIERLNNIINEYEMWLNDLGAWAYLEKLKELKESGNNE